MKKHHLLYSLVVFAFLFAMLPAPARCEEEFAPGYDACMEQAGGSFTRMRGCNNDAHQYWDKKLNAYYKKAMAKGCADNQCREKLKKAQRAWVAYKEAMSDSIYNVNGGDQGSMDGLFYSGMFLAKETKKQAELLDSYFDD